MGCLAGPCGIGRWSLGMFWGHYVRDSTGVITPAGGLGFGKVNSGVGLYA